MICSRTASLNPKPPFQAIAIEWHADDGAEGSYVQVGAKLLAERIVAIMKSSILSKARRVSCCQVSCCQAASTAGGGTADDSAAERPVVSADGLEGALELGDKTGPAAIV